MGRLPKPTPTMGRLPKPVLLLALAAQVGASHWEPLGDTLSLVQLGGPPARGDKPSTWLGRLFKRMKGNMDCWVDGNTYDKCCDKRAGPEGLAECWHGTFGFGTCCFAPTEGLAAEARKDTSAAELRLLSSSRQSRDMKEAAAKKSAENVAAKKAEAAAAEKAAEAKKAAEEAAAKKAAEEAAAKKAAKEAAAKKAAEQAAAKKDAEEAAAKKAAEEAAAKKAAEEAAAKKAAEEAAAKKAAEQVAAKKAAEEAAAKKAAEEAAAEKAAEEAAARKAAEEATSKKAAEEAAAKKAAEEAATQQAAEEAAFKKAAEQAATKKGPAAAELRLLSSSTHSRDAKEQAKEEEVKAKEEGAAGVQGGTGGKEQGKAEEVKAKAEGATGAQGGTGGKAESAVASAIELEKQRLLASAKKATEELATLRLERQRTAERERSREAAEEASNAAEREKRRLQEMHDRLVVDMRAKILAEAEAKVKQQMKERHQARQAELAQLKAEEKARREQRLALKVEQKEMNTKQEQKAKLDVERQKAEGLQRYLNAQKLKREAQREAARKKEEAAARHAENEARKAERERLRQEERARQRQLASVAAEVPAEDDHSLSLTLRDGLDREFILKVGRTSRLRTAMNVAIQRFGLDRSHTEFIFGGERVSSLDTPASIGMEHGDILTAIEVDHEVKDIPPSHKADVKPTNQIVQTKKANASRASALKLTRSLTRTSPEEEAASRQAEAAEKAYRQAKESIVETLHQINSDAVDWMNSLEGKAAKQTTTLVRNSVDLKVQIAAVREAKSIVRGKMGETREALWKYASDCREEVKKAMSSWHGPETAAMKQHELELTQNMAQKVQRWMEAAERSLPDDIKTWIREAASKPSAGANESASQPKAHRVTKEEVREAWDKIEDEVDGWGEDAEKRLPAAILANVQNLSKTFDWAPSFTESVGRDAKTFAAKLVAEKRAALREYVHSRKDDAKQTLLELPETSKRHKQQELQLAEKMAQDLRKRVGETEKALLADLNKWLLQFNVHPN